MGDITADIMDYGENYYRWRDVDGEEVDEDGVISEVYVDALEVS